MNKETKVRVMMLRERIAKKIDNPIIYGQVVAFSVHGHDNGDIDVDVRYDDGSHSDMLFSPAMGAYDMAYDAMQVIERACMEIRKQRRIFGT